MNDERLLAIFTESCLDQLERIEDSLLELEGAATGEVPEKVGRVFRAAHSIKGDAHSMGFGQLSELAHEIENVLERVRDGSLGIFGELVTLLLQSFDHLRELVRDHRKEVNQDLLMQLAGIGSGSDVPAPPRQDIASESPPPGGAVNVAESSGSIPPLRGDRGVFRVGLPTSTPPLIPPQGGNPKALRLDSTLDPDGAGFLPTLDPDGAGFLPTPDPDGAGSISTLDTRREVRPDKAIKQVPVRAEQLDKVFDQLEELTVAQERLFGLVRELRNEPLLSSMEDVLQTMATLRSHLLEMRMAPIRVSFGRFRRLVTAVSRQEEKTVELILRGGDTRLDNTVIEEIEGPLCHLLRNAVIHGIEPPRTRTERGKPLEGRVLLQAEHIGNEVVIAVEDDGFGIDTDALYRRSLATGRASPSQNLDHQELLQLILTAGPASIEKTDEAARRASGMEAVLRSVKALRGRMEVVSERGKGASFRIRFPFTLAIIQYIDVSVGECRYFVQLDHVENCVEFRRSQIEFVEAQAIFNLNGAVLPLICLRDFFEITGRRDDLAQIVVVIAGGERFGLVVDQVIGQRQAALKKLACLFGRLRGIMGASILENGQVVLVLDVPDILRSSLSGRPE